MAFEARSGELGFSASDFQFNCEGSSDDGYALGISLIQKKLLQKVIYCNNESIARGVAVALNESGIRIGKDLFLFTANNGPGSYCRYLTPPLTVINLRMREVFEGAMKVCLGLIARTEDKSRKIVIPPICIYRESLPEK